MKGKTAVNIQNACDALAVEIVESRSLFSRAVISGTQSDWQDYLNFRSAWGIRDDGNDYSISYMDDEQICQTLVEDVLMTQNAKRKGAYGIYPLEQAEAFIPDSMKNRVMNAVMSVIDMGLVTYDNGYLVIAEGRQDDAEDYSGVVFFDDDDHDVVDTHLMAGGTTLLSETFQDIAHELT